MKLWTLFIFLDAYHTLKEDNRIREKPICFISKHIQLKLQLNIFIFFYVGRNIISFTFICLSRGWHIFHASQNKRTTSALFSTTNTYLICIVYYSIGSSNQRNSQWQRCRGCGPCVKLWSFFLSCNYSHFELNCLGFVDYALTIC
jgi:hypothetical protein